MLLDPSRFAVLADLERHHAQFLAELDRLEPACFVPWPQRAAYEGADWLVFPLFLDSHPADLPVDFAANQSRCPESTRILRGLGVLAGAFSRMEPGCHILPHRDHPRPNVLRAHLGLRVPPGSQLRVGQDRGAWQEGRCLVMDGQVEHETANLGSEARTILLVDFCMNDSERAYAAAQGCPIAQIHATDRIGAS